MKRFNIAAEINYIRNAVNASLKPRAYIQGMRAKNMVQGNGGIYMAIVNSIGQIIDYEQF